MAKRHLNYRLENFRSLRHLVTFTLNILIGGILTHGNWRVAQTSRSLNLACQENS